MSKRKFGINVALATEQYFYQGVILGQPAAGASISQGFVAGNVKSVQKNSLAEAITGDMAFMVPLLDSDNAV